MGPGAAPCSLPCRSSPRLTAAGPRVHQQGLLGSEVLCQVSSLGGEKLAPRGLEGRGCSPGAMQAESQGSSGWVTELGGLPFADRRGRGLSRPGAGTGHLDTAITPSRAGPEAGPGEGRMSPVWVPAGGPLGGRGRVWEDVCPQGAQCSRRGEVRLCPPGAVCSSPSPWGSGRGASSSGGGQSLIAFMSSWL